MAKHQMQQVWLPLTLPSTLHPQSMLVVLLLEQRQLNLRLEALTSLRLCRFL
jgi:hypothetical protein